MKCLLACGFLLLLLATSIQAASAADPVVLKAGLSSREFKIMNALVRPWYENANEFYGTTHVGLAYFGSDLTPKPLLASKWEIASDGRSIKFYLAKNATWHDGKPVTAKDVKFTYEYWRDKHLYREGMWLNQYLDKVDVLDDHTGEIQLKEPYAYYVIKALFPTVYLVPEHVWRSVNETLAYEGSDAMVGAGPFIFERYDKDADVAYLKANPNYFLGKPAFDVIEWKHFRTMDSMLLALKRGEIDVILDDVLPEGVLAPSLLGEKGVTVEVGPNQGIQYLIFNYRKYPMNVTDFRKAVSYAVDYQALVDAAEAGYGEVPGAGLIPSSVAEYRPDIPKLEYNLTKANEILDSLEYLDTDGDGIRNLPNGKDLSIQLFAWPGEPKDERIAEMICYGLKKVGIDAQPLITEDATAQRIVYENKSFDMRVESHDPYMMALSFGLIDLVPVQYGTWDDPRLMELYNSTMSAKSSAELKSAVSDLQDYYAKEMPAIALIWQKSIYPYRSDRFEGWIPLQGYGLTSYQSWFAVKPAGK
jgi:peptide/nickel transport system substrate-binding protein